MRGERAPRSKPIWKAAIVSDILVSPIACELPLAGLPIYSWGCHGFQRSDWTDESPRAAAHDRHYRRQCRHVSGDEQPGLRGRVALSGADRFVGRAGRRLGADSGGRHGRDDRGLRAAQCRLQGAGARIQRAAPAGAIGACAAATPTPSSVASRSTASSIRVSTSIRVRGAFRITTAACSHYCKRLGVALEPFFQINYNAYLHSSKAFGGKPRRYREIKADYQGHVAELLAKATQQHGARCRGQQGRSGEAARVAARLGRARSELRATARAWRAAIGAAIRRIPAAA